MTTNQSFPEEYKKLVTARTNERQSKKIKVKNMNIHFPNLFSLIFFKYSRKYSWSAFLTLFLFSNIATAGGYTQLPRNLGPFEIGMSKAAFIKLSKVQPEACPICIENETYATIDANKLKQLDAGDTGGDGADFFFFNNTLYHIAAGTSVKDLFLAKQEFESQFGGPGKESPQPNGSSALVWEDTGTVVTVNYRADDNEVFSVNYYDWNLKEERDWRESIENQQTAEIN
ncbi:MAG: hypothetical protein OEX07_03010 [Gammaproteobacteria bacterium]|nr:hypothetical protein [Gammaproteobacteria bacterium]